MRYCKQVKRFLEDHDINFQAIELDLVGTFIYLF